MRGDNDQSDDERAVFPDDDEVTVSDIDGDDGDGRGRHRKLFQDGMSA